jgi:uncharacterized protein (DUF2237 family)
MRSYDELFSDGFGTTTPDDFGTHVVCAAVTKTFLEYSFSKGNNLMTKYPIGTFLD